MSRRLRTAVAVLLLLAGATSASAFTSDTVGIFWDDNNATNQTDTSAPNEVVTGHLVILEPSSGGGILAWECRLEVTGPAIFLSWNLAGQTINLLTPPQFTVGLASPLPPGAATTVLDFQLLVSEVLPVTIALRPTFVPSLPGEMAYIGNDNSEQLVPMRPWTGTAVVATVNQGIPVPSVTPQALRFDPVPLGGTANQTLRVTNVGGGVLPLEIALDCLAPGFSWRGSSGSTGLTGGQSLVLQIFFTPQQLGPAECTLHLGNGVPDVPILASGREPITSWSDPSDVYFGNRAVGSSTVRSTSLRNTGEVPFAVDVQWLDPCGDFEITAGGGPRMLQPGQYADVSVQFAPDAPGAAACTLSFGPGLPEARVTGTAIYGAPDYTIEPSAYEFPVTDLGATRSQAIRVTNTGPYPFALVPDLVAPSAAFSVAGAGDPVEVAPADHFDIMVTFAPTEIALYEAELFIGAGLPTVALSGIGGQELSLCSVSAAALSFSVPFFGESDSRLLTVGNLGNVPLELAPAFDAPGFSASPAAATVPPGGVQDLLITFAPTFYGQVSAVLTLGPEACTTVALTGETVTDITPGENLIGFFFDEAFTAIETGIGAPPNVVPVHLALTNPSDASGIAAWECRVAVHGAAQILSWDLAGNAINIADPNSPNEFTVGIGLEPLPYDPSGILLATFQILVQDPDPDNVWLELHPKFTPSLPHLMAWVPWGDLNLLLPMLPFTGQPKVAWFTSDVSVGIEMPAPLAVQTAGEVALEWPVRIDGVDGFHVYRHDPDGRENRLTLAMLPATTATVRFTDRPQFPAGTILAYSYAALRNGVEQGRSPATVVAVSELPVQSTRLLGNVPNPFNPETRIRFRLAEGGPARVTVFDVTGRRVCTLVDGDLPAGENEVLWNGRDDAGRNLSSGAYYVQLDADGQRDHRKILLLK